MTFTSFLMMVVSHLCYSSNFNLGISRSVSTRLYSSTIQITNGLFSTSFSHCIHHLFFATHIGITRIPSWVQCLEIFSLGVVLTHYWLVYRDLQPILSLSFFTCTVKVQGFPPNLGDSTQGFLAYALFKLNFEFMKKGSCSKSN